MWGARVLFLRRWAEGGGADLALDADPGAGSEEPEIYSVVFVQSVD